MSWVEDGYGIDVVKASRRVLPLSSAATYAFGVVEGPGLQITSTSTILLEGFGSPRLRMFVTDLSPGFEEIHARDDSPAAAGDCDCIDTGYERSRIERLDSDPTTFRFQFDATKTAASSGTVVSTCVPRERSKVDWPYVEMSSVSITSPWFSIVRASLSVTYTFVSPAVGEEHFVNYKDPCVIRVPDAMGGGWLMLVVRHRGLKANAFNANDSIQDIVAFWSESADFDCASGDVRGPYLLVHSLAALPNCGLRVFLGVPSGVFIRDESENEFLFVYYVVNVLSATPMDFSSSQADLYPTYVAAASELGVRETVAVKRIRVEDLSDAMGDVRYTDESTWETFFGVNDDGTVRTPYEIRGELLGYVRVWVADAYANTISSPWPASAWEDYWASAEGVEHRLVDPASVGWVVRATNWELARGKVVRIGDLQTQVVEAEFSDTMALYFSAHTRNLDVAADARQGYGIWRAAGIAAGEEIDTGGERVTTELGRDFVVHPPGVLSVERSPDQVAQSEGLDYFIDPDPVRLPDGSWQVRAGIRRYITTPGVDDAQGEQALFVGEADDGCRGWREAWT